MNYRRRNNNQVFIKNIRDYMVPIIGIILVLVLLFSAIGGGEEEKNNQNTDASNNESLEESIEKMSLDFSSDTTSGFVEYSGGNKDKLSEKKDLYPGEMLIVDNGDVTLKSAGGLLMKLNKNGELKYDLNGDFLLTSSDLFVKTSEAMNLNLRFLNLTLDSGVVLSLNQNEVGSSVYVLSGDVEVKTFAGKTLSLKAGEKFSITSSETTKEDYDIASQVTEIGNYFFSETWAQDNDLIDYLKVEDSESTDEETSTGVVDDTNPENVIKITSLKDGESFSSSIIKISGNLLDEGVSKVSFNGKIASINLVSKTFNLTGFSIPYKENDIVYKAYDSSGNLLERGVYTVYYTSGSSSTSKDDVTTENNFPFDDSNPQFTFISPSPNPYTTTTNFVTIRGRVTAGVASKVTVNGLTLKSFNGTTWRYHASEDFNTLKDGVNLYKASYYDQSGKIIHTNTFTIVKKASQVIAPPVTKKISGEASIQ